MSPARLLRLLYVNFVLVRHGLDEIVLSLHLFRPFRFMMLLNPFMWGGRRRRAPLGVRLREALQDLGPVWVKFGQMLSTRRDLLPDDIALELAALQDQVPPFPGAQARSIVEKSLGLPVDTIFAAFDSVPLASASIAQVHAAGLQDGREVVVKVVRPGIERRIRHDVGLMYTLADLAQRFWRDARRLRPREVVAEYETIIYDELDLIREASNASQLRRNFQNSPLLYVPAVEWDLCRRDVLVMERIRGIPISDVEQMRRHGIDLKKLSERGVEIFFTQVFRHNFFHADMHPGNIFVSYDHPESPRYIGVDFGIMGTLSPRDQRYLAENFVAFFNRDYQRVAELHVESGWVSGDTRVDEFEAAIRAVCEPIFQRPLSQISFGQLLLRLFQTARRFNMEVQPQLVLLQKTLLNIEGLGRQLDPDLDLWTTAKPFLERWMSEQLGARALLRGLKRNLPYMAEKLPDVPELAYKVLNQAAEGRLTVRWESKRVEALRDEIHKANERTVRAVSGAALLVCAFLAAGLETTWTFRLGPLEAPVLSWVLGVGGVALLVSAWLSFPRRS
jgi:ubiquinone biosynthesis protein